MEELNQGETTVKKRTKKAAITDDVLVRVKSCFYGKLYFKNPSTQEVIVWERQGEVQLLTMRDLRVMKARQVAFFKNQWILILGVADGEDDTITPEDIYNTLVIKQYYKNYVDPSDIAKVCHWSTKEISERVPLMTPVVRENLIVALNKCIKNGSLDSVKQIKAFEKALNCEFSYD